MKDGRQLFSAIIAEFDGEFDTQMIDRVAVTEYCIKPKNISSYLIKMYKNGELEKCGEKMVPIGNRTGRMVIWRKTAKFGSIPDMRKPQPIKRKVSPWAGWKTVYPEFFTTFPLPTGRVYRLEM